LTEVVCKTLLTCLKLASGKVRVLIRGATHCSLKVAGLLVG